MNKRRFLIIFIFLLSGLFITSSIFAQTPKTKKFIHADRNRDGSVDAKEMHMERKWEQRQRAKVNAWWERRADTNNDGIVDNNELSAWKTLEREHIDLNNDGVIDAKERRLCWRHARSKVNTTLEQKYDKNSNGWLEPEEAKELLKDRYTLIKTGGKAKVDTDIENEYDTDQDGIIDASEAEALREDLQ